MQDYAYDPGAGGMTENAMMSGYAWFVVVAVWIFFAYMQYRIAANRTGQADLAWWAFVPVLNTILLVKMADKPMHYILLLLVPLVNIVIFFYLWMEVASRCEQSKVWGFLVMVPFINLLAIFVLAYGTQSYSYSSEPSSPPRQPRTPQRVN